ncbi:hypothetical protein HKCCE3408_11985 [Rhodobacterales bacterium HKCCE3408]|nr:hypothetical protein [Rhodobacterales bacterium HKCCE3408]
MDTEGALVVELRKPDWAEDAPGLIAGLTGDAPPALVIDLSEASAPTAADGQLLLALRRHAQATGIPVELRGDAADYAAALTRLGLADALPGGGDQRT